MSVSTPALGRAAAQFGTDRIPQEDFEEHLNAALVTRPTIEQAKGVLVTLRTARPDEAFAELRHASQTHNVKLRRLADALVETASGRTPDDPELGKVIWQEWGRLLPTIP